MKSIINFIKKETILCVAILLGLLSMLTVHPDREYITYINTDTLILLFCLMAVMAGLDSIGIFSMAGARLLKRVRSARALELVLVMLCFFTSMAVTNDIALITFVPFTLQVFKMTGGKDMKRLAGITVLQTVAANLGSMLTPIGNPQNIYLYSVSGMDMGGFLLLTLPYTILAFILLTVFIVFGKNDSIGNIEVACDSSAFSIKKAVLYIVLFVLSLCALGRLLPYIVLLAIVIAALLIFDRKIFKSIDYTLLLTFVGFFVFTGNIGRIESINDLIARTIDGGEVVISVLLSQIISNVPAALLLSGFTEKWDHLIIGTDIGGLGTLIASMASLISYKYIAKNYPQLRLKYLCRFTAVNVIFLAALMGLYFVLS